MRHALYMVFTGLLVFASNSESEAARFASTVPEYLAKSASFGGERQSSADFKPVHGFQTGLESLSVTETWFFGSSTTDAGNLQAAVPLLPDPPYFEGRASNGSVWAEYFAGILGTDATASAFGGTNHAWGGARTAVVALGFIPPITAQVADYLSEVGFAADSDALYVLQTAANDLTAAKLEDPETAKQIMQDAVAATEAMLADLFSAGGRNFMLLTIPELPTAPVGAELPDGTNLARLANDGFRAVAREFELLGAGVWVVDLHALVDAVVADPETFGLEVAHCSFMGKDAIAIILGDTTPDPCEPSVPVDQYMMFDNEHFTTAMHEIVAYEALSGFCAGRRPTDASIRRPCIVTENTSVPSAATEPGLPHTQANIPDPVLERFVVSLSAREALEAMAAGDFTSEQYVALLLRRIENHPEINAFIHLDGAQALEAARATDEARAMGIDLGQLHGLPVVVKDSINTEHMPTSSGTPALDGFQPPANAPVVQVLIDAGAVILGKTNLHELSAGFTTTNFHFGATRNPYDFNRIPGGSSGGNGAVLAARFAPLAIGEDTGGSLRVPAALTGTMGFRPSSGRYPNSGIMPLSPTLDTAGPMGRTVADLALADSVITGDMTPLEEIALAGMRIGVPRAHFRDLLAPSVEKAFGKVLERLGEQGAIIVEADVPLVGDLTVQANLALNLFESVPAMTDYLAEHGAGVTVLDVAAMIAGPDVAFFMALALAGVVSEDDYLAVINGLMPILQFTYFSYFSANQLDLLLYPTVPIPAPEIGQQTVEIGGVMLDVFDAYFRHGHYAPLIGAPVLSLPMGQLPSGLPVGGVDIAGLPGDDRRVLAIGEAMTKVLPKIRSPKAITPLPVGE